MADDTWPCGPLVTAKLAPPVPSMTVPPEGSARSLHWPDTLAAPMILEMKPIRTVVSRLLVVAVCLPGCGGLPTGDDGTDRLDSGITGTVLAGPQCPVITPDSGPECDDQPFAATVIVRSQDGERVITQFTAGVDGRFRVELPPGVYQLDPQPGESGLPFSSTQEVNVEEGAFTELTILYDTGIR